MFVRRSTKTKETIDMPLLEISLKNGKLRQWPPVGKKLPCDQLEKPVLVLMYPLIIKNGNNDFVLIY